MRVDLERLASAVRMQSAQARVLLQHPDRDPHNFHLALAGVLRSMLCDDKWPTVLALARALSVDLRVWGPYPASASGDKPPSFAFNALTASAESVLGGHEMSVAEYLDAPIGAVTVPVQGHANGQPRWYTPRQLIKWAANKEGPAHFDPKSVATFASIGGAIVVSGSATMIDPDGSETAVTENDNFMLRTALVQIAQVAVAHADRLLLRYEKHERD